MTTPQILISGILVLLFAALVWGRWRYDVVAILALIAAVVCGLVPAFEAFTGFGHPATITVAAVLILSRALAGSGAMDLAARAVMRAGAHTTGHIGALAGLGGMLSGFMNNVGTLGLLMPVALQSAKKAARSPGLLLMPLSFGCILGGLLTLIGTPPNIIVAAYRGSTTGESFSMFDFTPVGGTVALVGLVFVALVGWRLIPQHALARSKSEDFFQIEGYVTEVRIDDNSKLIDKQLRALDETFGNLDLVVMELLRGERRIPPRPGREVLRAGDILTVEASAGEIDKLIAQFGVEIVSGKSGTEALDQSGDLRLTEAVIGPESRFLGRTVASLHLPRRYGVTIIAVSRLGRPYRGRLKNFALRTGDVLLLYGDAEHLPELITVLGALPLRERDLTFGRRKQAPWMIAIFAAAIALASFGLLSTTVALIGAVAVMVLFQMIPVRELYDGIDWPIIVLLGALIPVGGALQTTGTTAVIADAILTLTVGLSPVVVLTILLVVTMTLSDILNNAATAVVMAPIGADMATPVGPQPRRLSHGRGNRRLLRLPDADRTSEQCPDHGTWRLHLRRLLAHGPAFGGPHRPGLDPDDLDRLAALTAGTEFLIRLHPVASWPGTDWYEPGICVPGALTACR